MIDDRYIIEAAPRRRLFEQISEPVETENHHTLKTANKIGNVIKRKTGNHQTNTQIKIHQK